MTLLWETLYVANGAKTTSRIRIHDRALDALSAGAVSYWVFRSFAGVQPSRTY